MILQRTHRFDILRSLMVIKSTASKIDAKGVMATRRVSEALMQLKSTSISILKLPSLISFDPTSDWLSSTKKLVIKSQ